MIKNLFAGLYASLVVGSALVFGSGCGAAPEEFSDEDEIGSLEQGLTAAFAPPTLYGQGPFSPTSFDDRCGASGTPANSLCFVPDDKLLRFKLGSEWSVPPFGWAGALADAIGDARTAAGPLWTIDTAGTDSQERIRIIPTGPCAVPCDQLAGSGCVLGRTTFPLLSGSKVYNGHTYKGARRADIELYQGTIDYVAACLGTSSGAAAYTRFVANVIRHELGHALGLGHEPTGLMSHPVSTTELPFTLGQSLKIYAYVP